MSKPLIIISSTRVDEAGIWRNGLFQNVYLFFQLFRTIGYSVELFVNNPEECVDSALAKRFKVFETSRLITEPTLRIHYLLEIGMNCGEQVRDYFRAHGARIATVHLGNILNVDTEWSIIRRPESISHHLGGVVNDIWFSPHYVANAEYARVLAHLTKPGRIAPYVWDPCFLTKDGSISPKWSRPDDSLAHFVIAEPNISFQKCSVVPLMILESYYRQGGPVGRIAIVNGSILMENSYFTTVLAPHLHLIRDAKIDFLPRRTIHEIIEQFPSSIVVAHQITNELNYMGLEFLYMDYPYVHNCDVMSDVGYHYGGNNISAGVAAVKTAVATHISGLSGYRKRASATIHKYSIHNQANRDAWKALLA